MTINRRTFGAPISYKLSVRCVS